MRPSASLSSRKKAMISRLVRVSRLPVGSSHSRIGGWLTSARAMATRCCWPPESWFGLWSRRLPRPTRASISIARRLRSRRGQLRLYRSGTSTFSSAVVRDSRLKFWKMNPMRRLRTWASWSGFSPATSSPARR